MDQEALDALIAKNPAAKRQRVQFFRKRQQSTKSNESYSSNTVTTPNTASATTAEVNHRTSDRQSNFRGRGRGRGRGSQILQPTVHDPEQDWRTPTCSRPPEAESSCGKSEFKDGCADVDMQNGSSEGLSYVNRPSGCFHVHSGLREVPKVPPLLLKLPLLPIPRRAIRAITEPFGLHQDPPPSSGMIQIERDSCLCISRRFANHGGNLKTCQSREFVDHAISVDHPFGSGNQLQGNVPKGSIQQDPGSATRGQQTTERWPDDPEEFGELHWENSINVGRSTSWKADATQTTRAQKLSSVNIKFMDIDSNFNEASNPEPVLLEESANIMERSLVLARDAGNGDFYRLQRLSLANSSRTPFLLRDMEPQGSKTPYQHEGTVDSSVCTEAQDFSRKTSVGLLRQHNHTRLCQEIRGHKLPGITGINREDLVPLGRAQQTDSANRMVYISGDILDAELALWATRRRPVCIVPEQETRSLLQLVSGQQSTGTERSELRMNQAQQSVLLPTLEPDITGNPEGPPRESHNNISDSNVEIRNLVPRPDGAIDFTATASPSNKTLELDVLEDQQRFLETQGLGTYAIDFIVSKERRVRRRSRFSSIHQRFLDWRISSEISTPISTPQVINYLVEIYTVDKLNVGSIKTYKSAILQLSDNPAELAAHPMFSEFIKSLDGKSIKSFIRPVMDISPVIKLLREWGQNSILTVKQIIAKLFWLLSVTGFLRTSDIHRIDDQRSHIDQGVLNLVIVAPIEKRGGRLIEKLCQINPNIDIILCPVNAYMVYKEKIAANLCPNPHANNSNWVVNRLIRYVNDTSKPLSVDTIIRYIHTISDLIRRDPEAPILKGRAIGATLAANAGVSSDDIVSHAFWSNYTIFDTYYRLSINSSNNLTESILNLE
ncbi:hypothetical protein AYI70_g1678 [Smittium culicis]|uniref:Uncharacterized protein n=1 Tax=Smittium culicis TaxID=133412 RepID=A0A1R1YBM0_9FUNG|nr:hypothetical protein AYI70_g1678 [Smittium culicis]